MTITKTQKILKWALNKRTRNIAHAIGETHQTEKAFVYMLNRLVRHGLIYYSRVGQSVSLRLTKEAYKGRNHII